MDWQILKAFIMLMGIMGLLALVLYLVKRYLPQASNIGGRAGMEVLGRVSLLPKSHVFLVKIGDRKYVLGVTEHNVNVLDEFPIDEIELEKLKNTPVPASFGGLIEQFLQKNKKNS